MFRLVFLGVYTYACTLCPLRVPPRPRPLDQFKLPPIPDFNFDEIPKFCNISRSLKVEEQCRAGFENIFCTTDSMLDSLSCTGSENPSRCSECAHNWVANKWTITWWDSLGKPAAGVSDGNYYWLGEYDSCTELRREKKFNGQYCRMELEVPDAQVEEGCPQTDPLAIVMGGCFPASCTAEQLNQLARSYSPYKLKIDCEFDVSFSITAYIMLTVIITWVLFQIFATFYNTDSSWWLCFNVKINASRALSTKREPKSLHALHGLEFVVFVWLTTGNVYNYMQPYIENVAFSYDGVSSLALHPVNNFSYLVDGLLALSALYTTYLMYGELKTPRDILHVIRIRFVRFWPSYVFCVLFMWIMFVGISSGPMWIHSDTVARCSSSWWKNLLFINNFFGICDTCIDFGYVISLEAQFFIILIMLIYYARSHLFYSKVVAWSFILFSVVLTFYRTYSAGLPPAPLLTAEPIPLEITIAMLESVIISPFTRLSPYMVGFLFGIRMWNENGIKKDDIYNKMITFFASLLTVFSAIFVLFSLLPFATSSAGHPLFLSFYSAFHRPLWSFSLLSFLYLCHHGSFAWINAFLTWRIFSPLSKLSWIALIVAEPIILYFFTALNRPSYATNWSTIYASVSAATMSYLVALTIDIFLARPIRLLVNREELHGYRQPNT